MNKKLLPIIVISLVTLLAAGLGIYSYIQKRSQKEIRKDTALFALRATHIPYTPAPACVTVESPEFDHNSVASESDDCSPLSCAVQAASKLTRSANVPINRSNQDAVDNIKSCLAHSASRSSALIIGHGADGLLQTGKGATIQDQLNSLLSSDNQQNWTKIVNDGLGMQSKLSTLTLLGCSTGSGGSAQNFLSVMKDKSGALSVRAPMEDVFCENAQLYMINTASFLSVPRGTPTTEPSPVAGSHNFMVLRHDEENADKISVQDLSELILSRNKNAEAHITELTDLQQFFDSIDKSSPFIDNGCPVANKVGTLMLVFKNNRVPRALTVFSNGLLRDLSQRDVKVYYRTNWSVFSTGKHFFTPTE